MTQFKSQDLLQNASVALSVGDRPATQRNMFKVLAASAVLLAAAAISPAQAQTGASFDGQSDKQVLAVQQDQVIGEVISVRHVRDTSRRSHRGEISPRSLAGALLGGVIGNQVGGGNGKKLATLVGALGGGSIANRLADRRNGKPSYENARQIQDNDEVTVRVANGHSFETYQITQSAGFDLKRGDAVALMTSKDGKTLMALPIAAPQPELEQEDRNEDRPSTRNRRPR